MVKIEVIISDGVSGIFPLDRERVRTFAASIVKSSGFTNCDVNIVFIDDENMTELNTHYRKRNSSTDVLSFNLSEEYSDILEGEVYISLERAKEQALDWNVPCEEEIIRLVTHGLLHLTGRTHATEEECKTMTEDTEKFIQHFFMAEK